MTKKKKKAVQTPKTKAPSKKINCACGSEWDRKEVEADDTTHTMADYRYRFLRRFDTDKSGFYILDAVLACPDCRITTLNKAS